MGVVIMSVTETAGFEIVTSISQDTVNFQIFHLFKMGVIPKKLDIELDDTGISIKADLLPPTVDFGALDSASAVLFSLNMRSGTFTYWEGNGPKATQQHIDFQNWVYTFDVNLNFQQIEQSALQVSAVVPDVVKQTLSNFTADMFTIQHLFLDFENTGIARYDADRTKMPAPGGTRITAGQMTQWQNALQSYFTGLAASANPYILGYTPSLVPAKIGTVSLFTPTGATFSTYRGAATSGDNTLNFLLMTHGRALPLVPPNGMLSASPITSHADDGAMVIAPGLFTADYLQGSLLYLFTDFTGAPFTHDGNQWTASSSTSDPHLPTTNSVIFCDLTKTRSATVTLTTGSTPTVHVAGEYKMSAVFSEDTMGHIWDGTATYALPWTLDVVLSAGTNGTIVPKPTFTLGKESKDSSENVFQKLGDVFSAGLAPGIQQAQALGQSLASSITDAIKNNVGQALNTLGQVIVLPGGDVFMFSGATLLDDYGLRFDITYNADR
jgi:hypothetical protein